MRSDKQIEASRRNGAKSRGPITPEGRANSQKASWQQNILARTVVLEGESRDRFNQLYRSLIEELQPTTPIERLLTQKMAVSQWRQMRLWSLEKSNPDLNERSTIHETRYDRQFERALNTLHRLRNKKAPPNPTTP